MKPISTKFLQAVILLIGIGALILLIRMPLIEGRAKNLDLLHIYLDPFILYGYATSIAVFVALYEAFQLLGLIRQKKVFSPASLRNVRSIKYCAIILSAFIMAAGLYIRIFHHKDDDPTGFMALCIIISFGSFAIAVFAGVFEEILQNGLDLLSQNGATGDRSHEIVTL